MEAGLKSKAGARHTEPQGPCFGYAIPRYAQVKQRKMRFLTLRNASTFIITPQSEPYKYEYKCAETMPRINVEQKTLDHCKRSGNEGETLLRLILFDHPIHRFYEM